jgi:hypothetical protein
MRRNWSEEYKEQQEARARWKEWYGRGLDFIQACRKGFARLVLIVLTAFIACHLTYGGVKGLSSLRSEILMLVLMWTANDVELVRWISQIIGHDTKAKTDLLDARRKDDAE